MPTTQPSPSAHSFPETRWSVVLSAVGTESGDGVTDAVEAICQGYWFPLYAFARRSGYSPHDAQDITQEFFRRLLEKRWLDSVDREKGRLRTFLIMALKRLMAKQERSQRAQRRGGGCAFVSIDVERAEDRYESESGKASSAGEIYDRQWALTLLHLTMDRLKRELLEGGRGRDFEVLKPFLMTGRGGIDYDRIAMGLGVKEGAARVAIHRFRKRFRALYRDEIAHTLTDEAEIDEEMRYLARVLAQPGS